MGPALASLLVSLATLAPRPQAPLTPENRREELALLWHTIETQHPDPFHSHARAEWERELAAVGARADQGDDARFFIDLCRLVAWLPDGHSSLAPMRSPSWPLEFRFFADGLYVVAAAPPYGAAVGGRVTSLDAKPTADVVRTLASLVAADNPEGALVRIAQVLLFPRELHAAGVLTAPDRARLALERDGKTVEVELGAPVEGPPPFLAPRPANWVSAAPPAGAEPLWLRHPERNYWREFLADGHALYVRFARVQHENTKNFHAFCAELESDLDGPEVERVLIDLRGNHGGNNYLTQPLVHAVLKSHVNVPGGVFVLTDRETFSAAGNCANRLERETWALFVGEPPGACPNSPGDPSETVLPHSGWIFSCSTVLWQDSDPSDQRRWILPDLPAPLTFADYHAGRDPALDQALAFRATPMAGYTGVAPIAHWQRATQQASWKLSGGFKF